jgi:hypothetical protein
MTSSPPNVTAMLHDWAMATEKRKTNASELSTTNCIARPHATYNMNIPVSHCRPQT